MSDWFPYLALANSPIGGALGVYFIKRLHDLMYDYDPKLAEAFRGAKTTVCALEKYTIWIVNTERPEYELLVKEAPKIMLWARDEARRMGCSLKVKVIVANVETAQLQQEIKRCMERKGCYGPSD